MSSVFICYRREDTAPYAGWLRQALVGAFGKDRVFMDIDTIAPGADFEEVIQETLDKVDAVLVLIGPKWASVKDSTNARRLDNPDDYIRLEVSIGLRRRIRVVPVLVGGATVPRGDQLPDDLRSLARRQAVELTETRWEYDTSRLIDSLKVLDQPTVNIEPSPLPPIQERQTAVGELSRDAPVLMPQELQVAPSTVPPAPAVVAHGETPEFIPEAVRTEHEQVDSIIGQGPVSFVTRIGVAGPTIRWSSAITFAVATLVGAIVSQVAVNPIGLSSDLIIRVVIRGLLESLVALTAFRWLPLGVACGAVGISMGALTLGNLVLSGYWTRLSYGAIQISPWIYVCAAFSSTFLYYAATSWALNRFGWVLLTTSIVGGVSGLVGPVMFMVFSEVTPTFSAGGLLEGFVLGIALWLGGRDAHSTVRLEES